MPCMAVHLGALRRQLADGTWVGSLICLPFVAVLIFLAVQSALQHHWGKLAGLALIVLVLLTVPAGGLKWLARVIKATK